MSIEEQYAKVREQTSSSAKETLNIMELAAKNREQAILLEQQQHEIAELWRRVGGGEPLSETVRKDGERVLPPTEDREQELAALIVELEAFERRGDMAGRYEFLKQWRRNVEKRAAREASRDPLTGLPNRRAFLEDAGKILEVVQDRAQYDDYLAQNPDTKDKRVDEPADPGDFSVIMLDLDHFKSINDTHGHAAGDEVLRRVADVLRKVLRPTDEVARWGGEEFIVAFKSRNPGARVVVAEKIRRAIESAQISFNDIRLPVTASVGAAKWKKGEHMLDVIQSADANLYRAKDAGRNRIAVDNVE